jgi:hypothetical protein
MRRFHVIFGVLVVIAFLLTGQYMDKFYNHLAGMADGPRLLYRTRHIFILLSGLLHLGFGTYFVYRRERWRRIAQLLGSLMITASSILFIVAFFQEPKLADLYTPLSHKGMYLIAVGTLLHLFSAANEPG